MDLEPKPGAGGRMEVGKTVDDLLSILKGSMPKADQEKLREIAESTIKELRSIQPSC